MLLLEQNSPLPALAKVGYPLVLLMLVLSVLYIPGDSTSILCVTSRSALPKFAFCLEQIIKISKAIRLFPYTRAKYPLVPLTFRPIK